MSVSESSTLSSNDNCFGTIFSVLCTSGILSRSILVPSKFLNISEFSTIELTSPDDSFASGLISIKSPSCPNANDFCPVEDRDF